MISRFLVLWFIIVNLYTVVLNLVYYATIIFFIFIVCLLIFSPCRVHLINIFYFISIICFSMTLKYSSKECTIFLYVRIQLHWHLIYCNYLKLIFEWLMDDCSSFSCSECLFLLNLFVQLSFLFFIYHEGSFIEVNNIFASVLYSTSKVSHFFIWLY
jgi:hypothetical protein